MLLAIVSYRYPGLPGAVHTAFQALLLTLAMLAALALAVTVCMAVAPVLMQMATAAAIIGGYAMLTYPKAKVQSCK
jgi:hypothetical protein